MGTTQYMGENKSRVRDRRTAREPATESEGTIVSRYAMSYNNIRIRLCHGNTFRKIAEPSHNFTGCLFSRRG